MEPDVRKKPSFRGGILTGLWFEAFSISIALFCRNSEARIVAAVCSAMIFFLAVLFVFLQMPNWIRDPKYDFFRWDEEFRGMLIGACLAVMGFCATAYFWWLHVPPWN